MPDNLTVLGQLVSDAAEAYQTRFKNRAKYVFFEHDFVSTCRLRCDASQKDVEMTMRGVCESCEVNVTNSYARHPGGRCSHEIQAE